ncbi:hypothetical protein KDX32_32920, partial [Burkholderia ambifaria]|nr:hypothetical protein [Burkholderia ambifaria]MBR8278846.1 hypothetical protein [Burkholderia cenocepacia]
MNHIYRSIWNESLGSWVAASELESACGSGGTLSNPPAWSSVSENQGAGLRLPTCKSALALVAMALLGADNVFAGEVAVCNQDSSANVIRNGASAQVSRQTVSYCADVFGVGIVEDYNQPTGGSRASLFVGTSAAGQGQILLYGPNGITLSGSNTSVANNKIVNLAPGTNGTDAVNFSQLTSLSTSTSTGIGSLSTGLGSTNSTVASLSTSVSNAKTHYFSVTDAKSGGPSSNYNNDGATGKFALAVGAYASATGDQTVAIGPTSTASALNAIAIGNFANSGGANSVALGNIATAGGPSTVAIGPKAVANNANDVALGAGSVTAGANATASGTIGGQTYQYAGAAPTSVVSVGAAGAERQITNVAAGRVSATSTDAINGSQLYATNQAIDALSTSTNTAVGSLSTAVNNANTHYFSVTDAKSGGRGSNYNNDGATGKFALAVGAYASATGDQTVAIGPTSTASALNAIAIGNFANSGGTNSVALGNIATAGGPSTVAIGPKAVANNANDVALGAGSVTAEANATASGTIGGQRYQYA